MHSTGAHESWVDLRLWGVHSENVFNPHVTVHRSATPSMTAEVHNLVLEVAQRSRPSGTILAQRPLRGAGVLAWA